MEKKRFGFFKLFLSIGCFAFCTLASVLSMCGAVKSGLLHFIAYGILFFMQCFWCLDFRCDLLKRETLGGKMLVEFVVYVVLLVSYYVTGFAEFPAAGSLILLTGLLQLDFVKKIFPCMDDGVYEKQLIPFFGIFYSLYLRKKYGVRDGCLYSFMLGEFIEKGEIERLVEERKKSGVANEA